MTLTSYLSSESFRRVDTTPISLINREEWIQHKNLIDIKLFRTPFNAALETYEFKMGWFGLWSQEEIVQLLKKIDKIVIRTENMSPVEKLPSFLPYSKERHYMNMNSSSTCIGLQLPIVYSKFTMG